MSGLFAASYVALWCFVVVTLILTVLLYRQYGLTLMPGRERINLRGLDIGASPPALLLNDSQGQPLELSWGVADSTAPGVAQVAVFAEPTCPICESLLESREDLSAMASKWSALQFIWVDAHSLDDRDPDGWTVAVSGDGTAVRSMQIPAFPFAYVVSGSRIVAKGLVNVPEDIEELVQSTLGSHPGRDNPFLEESRGRVSAAEVR